MTSSRRQRRSSSTRPRTGCTPSRRCSSPPWPGLTQTSGVLMRYVIALGGNALLHRFERPDAGIQRKHVREAAAQLAPAIAGHEVYLCHGNGPQIGVLANESDADLDLALPFPLDTLGAQTQGMIGYWLAQELANAGVTAPIAVVLTQTVVDAADPAFAVP